MAYSEQELTKMIAFISMLLAFMQFEQDSSADRIGDIENIAPLIKAILEHVGQAPYVQSLSFFWQCGTQALLTMETQYFPGLPCETPPHLAVPRHCLPLSRVNIPSWNHNQRLIEPGFLSLITLKNCSRQTIQRRSIKTFFRFVKILCCWLKQWQIFAPWRFATQNPLRLSWLTEFLFQTRWRDRITSPLLDWESPKFFLTFGGQQSLASGSDKHQTEPMQEKESTAFRQFTFLNVLFWRCTAVISSDVFPRFFVWVWFDV